MKLAKVLLIVVPLLVVALFLDALLMRLTGGARILDPFLIVVVSQAPHGRKSDAVFTGALAGLFQDLVGSVVFGIHALSKTCIGYLASLLSGQLIPGQPLTSVVLLAGGTVLEAVVQWLVGVLLGQSVNTPQLGTLALSVVLNVALGLPALALIDMLARRRPRHPAHARGR